MRTGLLIGGPPWTRFTPQPAAVRAWLEEYPVIEARAKAEGAAIAWVDQCGLRLDAAPPGRLEGARLTVDRLAHETRRFLRRRQRRPHIVGGYLHAPHVRYAIMQETGYSRLDICGRIRVRPDRPRKWWITETITSSCR